MASPRLPLVLRYVRKVVGRAAAADGADGPLLERFVRRRDGDAFAALVERHGPMVLGVCRRVLRDRHDAEDAFQATFLVLARKAGAIRRRELLANWLHGVAYRTALKARAGAARWQAPREEVADPSAGEPAVELAWRELRLALDEELRRLPYRYRAPLVLCYLQGKTYAEAAGLLGWPAGTVSGRLARARELLRARLGRRGLTLSAGLLGTLLAEQALSATVAGALHAATAEAAPAWAAGPAGTAAVSAPAAALAEGVLKTMFLTRLTTALILFAVLGLLGTGAGLLAYPGRDGGQPAANGDAHPAVKAKEGTSARSVKNGLSLAIRLDRTAYGLNDPVTLSFRLKNESDRPLYIGDGALAPKYHEAGPGRHFEVHVTAGGGVPLHFWTGQMTEGQTAGIRRVFLLKPGQSYEGSIRLSAGHDNDRDFARRPHGERGGSFENTRTHKPHVLGKDGRRYTVVLRYQVEPETHGVFEPPAGFKKELLWMGKLDSPPLAFTVGGTPAQGLIPLESVYGTTGQKEIRNMSAGFNVRADGKKVYREPYGPDLDLLNSEGRQGASNVFLVRGRDVKDAVQATWEVFAARAPADVPPAANRQARQAPLWAVAFFGITGSSPVAWKVRAVTVKGKAVRIAYETGEARTNDLHPYYAWVPLGRLEPGAYTVELFDAGREEVTLLRRCRVLGN
jgi:RNA polymerase sigma factor (sigma-70 family)